MVQRSLYDLIGVDQDADPAAIRRAYEEAMRRATRGGDHRRAVELSQAYDALHPRTRSTIFPAARSGHGSISGGATVFQPDFTAPRRRRQSAIGRSIRPGRRRSRAQAGRPTRSDWLRRSGAALMGIALVLLIGIYVWRTAFPHPQSYPVLTSIIGR